MGRRCIDPKRAVSECGPYNCARGMLWVGWAFAVYTIDPRNSRDARLNRHFQRVADVKAIEIVGFDRYSFQFPARPPGSDYQSPASPHDSFHVKRGSNGCGNVLNIFGGVEFP